MKVFLFIATLFLSACGGEAKTLFVKFKGKTVYVECEKCPELLIDCRTDFQCYTCLPCYENNEHP